VSIRRAATHVLFGIDGGVANIVYGTVVVMAALTAAVANEDHPWRLAVIVFTSAFVLWIAHVYAHGLSETLQSQERLDGGELLRVARREIGIMLAAVAPTVALLLGAAGLFREDTAIWLALGAGLLTLGVEGQRYARLKGLGPLATLLAVALNLSLGLIVVALKVAVAH
jgi:hypothetical protein